VVALAVFVAVCKCGDVCFVSDSVCDELSRRVPILFWRREWNSVET